MMKKVLGFIECGNKLSALEEMKKVFVLGLKKE